jgi:ABC-2 type transport system permease protein
MIKLVLRLFDMVAWLIRAFGVDYPQFRAILETKLTLDSRRRMVGLHVKRQKKAGNTFAATLVFYGFMGTFVGFAVLVAGSPLVGMTVAHAFIMTMLSMALISDFSSVLLDTTDNAILQPRPVTGRTILVARIAHIVVYLASLSLSLGLVTLITGTCRWGAAFPPVFIFTLAFAIILVVCLVNLLYVAAMRLTSGERLRDIILYFQMFMTVLIVGGYQLLPRLVDMRLIRELQIDDRWWIYLFPPTWMAAPIDLLAGHLKTPQLILSAMAVVLPLAGLVVVLRVLGPRFSRALAEMDTVSKSRAAPSPVRGRNSTAQRLAGLCCRTRVGQAAFEFVWLLCSRDRQFKLRTYPSFAIIFIFPIFFLLSGHEGFREAFAGLSATKNYLFVLYMAGSVLPSTLVHLRFSDNWQAAWVYDALPVALPGEIFAAAMKALIVRFVIPAFAIVSCVTLAIWGPRIVGDLALAASATLVMCVLQGLFFGRRFPFSQAFGVTDASGRAGRTLLLVFLVPAALGFLHYRLTSRPLLVPLMIPVVLLAAVLLFRAYARTSWAAVQQ